jgi:hypothetical protein
MGPIKLLARMGMFGGLINKFDRGIEILDDLDDHWYIPYFSYHAYCTGPRSITRKFIQMCES